MIPYLGPAPHPHMCEHNSPQVNQYQKLDEGKLLFAIISNAAKSEVHTNTMFSNINQQLTDQNKQIEDIKTIICSLQTQNECLLLSNKEQTAEIACLKQQNTELKMQVNQNNGLLCTQIDYRNKNEDQFLRNLTKINNQIKTISDYLQQQNTTVSYTPATTPGTINIGHKQQQTAAAVETAPVMAPGPEPGPATPAPSTQTSTTVPENIPSVTSEPPNEAKIDFVTGDVRSAPKKCAIAHDISGDKKLTRGMANTYIQDNGRCDELNFEKTGQALIGEIIVTYGKDGRMYIHVVTKAMYYHNAKTMNEADMQSNFVKGMRELRVFCDDFMITDIAIPRIGCGRDRLRWDFVYATLKDVFQGCSTNITVYSINQDWSTQPARQRRAPARDSQQPSLNNTSRFKHADTGNTQYGPHSICQITGRPNRSHYEHSFPLPVPYGYKPPRYRANPQPIQHTQVTPQNATASHATPVQQSSRISPEARRFADTSKHNTNTTPATTSHNNTNMAPVTITLDSNKNDESITTIETQDTIQTLSVAPEPVTPNKTQMTHDNSNQYVSSFTPTNSESKNHSATTHDSISQLLKESDTNTDLITENTTNTEINLLTNTNTTNSDSNF